MKSWLVRFAAGAILLLLAGYGASRESQIEAEIASQRLENERLRSELSGLPLGSPVLLSFTRARIEEQAREIGRWTSQIREQTQASMLRGVAVREAGAARDTSKLPPQIRNLLQPVSASLSTEEIGRRWVEQSVLEAALEAKVVEIDLLTAQPDAPSAGSDLLTGSVFLRYRGAAESPIALLSLLSNPGEDGPLLRIQSIRIQRIQDQPIQHAIDLELRTPILGKK